MLRDRDQVLRDDDCGSQVPWFWVSGTLINSAPPPELILGLNVAELAEESILHSFYLIIKLANFVQTNGLKSYGEIPILSLLKLW